MKSGLWPGPSWQSWPSHHRPSLRAWWRVRSSPPAEQGAHPPSCQARDISTRAGWGTVCPQLLAFLSCLSPRAWWRKRFLRVAGIFRWTVPCWQAPYLPLPHSFFQSHPFSQTILPPHVCSQRDPLSVLALCYLPQHPQYANHPAHTQGELTLNEISWNNNLHFADEYTEVKREPSDLSLPSSVLPFTTHHTFWENQFGIPRLRETLGRLTPGRTSQCSGSKCPAGYSKLVSQHSLSINVLLKRAPIVLSL